MRVVRFLICICEERGDGSALWAGRGIRNVRRSEVRGIRCVDDVGICYFKDWGNGVFRDTLCVEV